MLYVSWEMLGLYLITAGLYIGFTGLLVGLLWTRGEPVAAIVLAPVVVLSWVGMLGQVAHVAEASSEMRRTLIRS
jgi:hypothetical protein